MRVEAKWLVRLILKDLGLEVPARSIMQGFHKDLYRMFLRRGDLRIVCEQAAKLHAHPETASTLSTPGGKFSRVLTFMKQSIRPATESHKLVSSSSRCCAGGVNH